MNLQMSRICLMLVLEYWGKLLVKSSSCNKRKNQYTVSKKPNWSKQSERKEVT